MPLYPQPPLNTMVVSPFGKGVLDIRWDDPSFIGANTEYNIIGVNVYRSEASDRGPFKRLNSYPVSGTFYRDFTDVVMVSREVIPWNGGWQSKGDAPNLARWTLKTRYPIAKPRAQGIPANSPDDVMVTIDGVPAWVGSVFGQTGEVTLQTHEELDPRNDRGVLAPLPTETSEVAITYYTARNVLYPNTMVDRKLFYRVTTVAVAAGSTTGYIETPLDQTMPASDMQIEQLDYIWREGMRRNRWILEQGGERVKLFVQKVSGMPCPCSGETDPQSRAYNKQPSNRCHVCFVPGTLVRTETGYRPIEQVRVGDRVLSSDGLYHSVTEVMETPFDGDLVSLMPTVSTRPILTTPEHPFLVLRGDHNPKTGCGPKCNSYIARGDGMERSGGSVRLLPSGKWWARAQVHGSRGSGRKPLGTYDTKEDAERAVQSFREGQLKPGHVLEWDDAQNVRAGNWLVPQWNRETRDVTEVEVPPEFRKVTRLGESRLGPDKFAVDEDFLWMVGIFLAEGSSGSRSLNFALHVKETAFQDRLLRIFTRYGYNPKVRHTRGNGCVVLVNSTSLSQWFPMWLGRGCENKHIPEELMALPPEKTRALVQGIYDGDGSKRENEITQTSEVLALQVAELLHRVGEQPLIRQFHQRALTPKGNQRKVAYAVNWAEATITRTNRKGRWAFQDKVLSQVREVERVPYTGPVYNLEVEGDHTYVVQGVVTHNCYGTGFVGGYEGPYDILVAPDDAEKRISQTPNGRRKEHTYEVWSSFSPIISMRDFLMKQNNERYSIGPVRRPTNRGNVMQQHFNIAYLDPNDIRYEVPVEIVLASPNLPWPQTRYPYRPYRETYDQQTGAPWSVTPDAVFPMSTEKDTESNGVEIRWRTGTGSNQNY